MPYGTKRKATYTPTTSKRVRSAPKALAPKRRKPRYRANLKLSKPFKAVLNQFLDSKHETHWETLDIPREWIQQYPIKHPATAAPRGFYRILPPITQAGITVVGGGVMTNNIESREGSKVRLKSLSVSLQLRLNPTYQGMPAHAPEDATGIRFKVFLLSCKAESSYTDVVKDYFQTANTTGLQIQQFKNGKDPVMWDDKMEHYDFPINTNLFTVHDSKQGMLLKGEVLGQPGAGGIAMAPSAVRNLRLKVKCKSKILKYDTSGSQYPTNFNPFCVVFWKTMNGYSYLGQYPTVPEFVQCVGSSRMSWDDMD